MMTGQISLMLRVYLGAVSTGLPQVLRSESKELVTNIQELLAGKGWEVFTPSQAVVPTSTKSLDRKQRWQQRHAAMAQSHLALLLAWGASNDGLAIDLQHAATTATPVIIIRRDNTPDLKIGHPALRIFDNVNKSTPDAAVRWLDAYLSANWERIVADARQLDIRRSRGSSRQRLATNLRRFLPQHGGEKLVARKAHLSEAIIKLMANGSQGFTPSLDHLDMLAFGLEADLGTLLMSEKDADFYRLDGAVSKLAMKQGWTLSEFARFVEARSMEHFMDGDTPPTLEEITDEMSWWLERDRRNQSLRGGNDV